MIINRKTIESALQLDGFENWVPSFYRESMDRPRSRPSSLDGDGRLGAVLLLLFEEEHDIKIVLTRRSEELKHHPGQISFPGGRVEGKESLQQAAIREANEEIGVHPESIQIVGSLNQIYIPPSDFTVSPFVGWHHGPPILNPQESEVAEVLVFSISDLLNPLALIDGPFECGGKARTAPHYSVNESAIWGATAIILTELLDRIRSRK